MTQQIINTGTGPDSYTGDTLRTAFTKVNDNFSQLYAGNVGGNITVANVTASGNVTADYFFGNGALLTGITSTADLGNLTISGPTNQSIVGTVTGPIFIKPFAGSSFIVHNEYDGTGISANLVVGSLAPNVVNIRPGNNSSGALPLFVLGANSSAISFNGTTDTITVSSNDSLRLNSNNGIIFTANTVSGYNYNFVDGSLFSREFYAEANFPTGYQFNTPGGDTGLSHTYEGLGNISVLRLRHDSSEPAKFYENNTTLLSGNLVVIQNGSAAGNFPNAFVQTYSTANTYTQFVWQNLSTGSASTGDIVVTSDTGTDTTNYIDMGMTGSAYDNTNPSNSLGTSVDHNDGYLYVQGVGDGVSGNLTIGTVNAGTITKIISGGVNAENVVATFSATGLTGNVAFTMANSSQWTSNVYTISDALNQLAARIWAIENP